MKKNNKMLVFFPSVLMLNTLANADVSAQFHADEKRNVKQPPLLDTVFNFTQKFYNAMSVPCMMS